MGAPHLNATQVTEDSFCLSPIMEIPQQSPSEPKTPCLALFPWWRHHLNSTVVTEDSFTLASWWRPHPHYRDHPLKVPISYCHPCHRGPPCPVLLWGSHTLSPPEKSPFPWGHRSAMDRRLPRDLHLSPACYPYGDPLSVPVALQATWQGTPGSPCGHAEPCAPH